MNITVKGLVIQEYDLKEKDKIVRIFTDTKGIISAIVRRGKNLKSRNCSIIQLFAYYKFNLYVGKNSYIVEEAEILELFWTIRQNLDNLALSQYFCQLCTAFHPSEERSSELLRLLLNTLYLLSKNKKSPSVLKAVFELRGSSLCGYMPDLTGCTRCKKYENEKMIFFIEHGIMVCPECLKSYEKQNGQVVSISILKALRHTIYSEIDKLFSFDMSENTEKIFCDICEKYILSHIGSGFKALDFYKSIQKFI